MNHNEMVMAILDITKLSHRKLGEKLGCGKSTITRLNSSKQENCSKHAKKIEALYDELCNSRDEYNSKEGSKENFTQDQEKTSSSKEESHPRTQEQPEKQKEKPTTVKPSPQSKDENDKKEPTSTQGPESQPTFDAPDSAQTQGEKPNEGELRSKVYTALFHTMQQRPDRGLHHAHRKELQMKRGFTPETIQRIGVMTASRVYLQPAIETLYAQGFTPKDLHAAGLLESPAFSSVLNPVLLENEKHPYGRYLLPYLYKDRSAYHLRPHKRGFKNAPIQVFGLNMLEQGAERIVITEGEFKAAALWQCEIAAIAVPGISSFVGTRFRELLELLVKFVIKSVVILFDNEAKNNPNLPNYKEDPQKRHDTDYYAVRLAKQLSQSGIQSSLIARFPDKWRVEGKIDPDLALSQGRNPEELLAVVERAVTPEEYVLQLSSEGRIVVGFKLAKDEDKSNNKLRVSTQGYLWPVQRGQETYQVSVSNFTMTPLMTRYRVDGARVRIYQARNNRGEDVKIQLEPKDLRDPRAFRLAMSQAGNFEWTGNSDSFYSLTRRLTARMPPLEVQEQDTFGKQEDGSWLFKGGMVREGQIILPSSDGILWEGLKGITPISTQTAIPDLPLTDQKNDFSLLELGKILVENLGTPAVWLSLGWILAVAFADLIFKKFKFFPLLGLFGRKGSGKTVLARHLVGMWGLSTGFPLIWHSSTPKGVDRTIAQMSSLPVWKDEFRNNVSSRLKSALRGYFDRSSGVMAAYTNSLETRTLQPKGCIIISGEELPDDPAVVDRTVAFELDHSTRKSELYGGVKELFLHAHKAILHILLHQEGMEQEILTNTEHIAQGLQNSLGARARGDRMVQTHAIPVAVLLTYMDRFEVGWEESMTQFVGWLQAELPRMYEQRCEADHLERFWRQIGVLSMDSAKGQSPAINRNHLLLSRDRKTLWLYLDSVYGEVAKFVRSQSGEVPFSQETIRQYLHAASYFKGTGSRKLAGQSRRCHGIKLHHPECPQAAKEVAQTVFSWSAIPGSEFDSFEDNEELEA